MRTHTLLAVSVTWSGGAGSAAAELAAGLADCQLPATWILAEQAPSTAKFLNGVACDLGLQGPGGLLAAERARSVIVEALALARSRAARHGLTLSTVLGDDRGAARHAELLAKYGVSCVTGNSSAPSRGAAASLRYGLWRIPVDVSWPWSMSRGWFGGATLSRRLRESTSQGVMHVRFDVEALAQAGRAGLARLSRDLEQLASLAHHQGLRGVTLAGAAERLSCPRPRVEPARSILRAA